MASTFSPSLKLELIGNGDQSGTWGTTTNTNLGTLLEQAITGVQAITMVNANVTLTSLNGVSDEARNAVLVVGGTNSAIRSIIAPSVNKTYIIANNTVGGFAIIIKTSAGTGLTIPNGATQIVYCDGSEFYSAGFSTSGGAITGNLTIGGTLGVTGATTLSNLTASSAVATNASKVLVSVANSGTGDNVLSSGATLSSPTINSPTLTTPALGTPASGVLTNCTGTATGLTAGAATNAVFATTAGSAPANGGTATNLSGGSVAATTITATGNIIAYYSDDRLKTKLGNITDALAKVQSLNGFYYEANAVAQELGYEPIREVGVSAQQVQAILPEIVAPAPIDNQYLTVHYERLVPLLIEAIKELKSEVDDLKKAK